jgi:hypothetical protein
LGGNPIGTAPASSSAWAQIPALPNLDEEIKRFEYKVQAGAEYVVTQPVFDLSLLENFLKTDRALPHSRGRRNLAAGQCPQRRIHEETSCASPCLMKFSTG